MPQHVIGWTTPEGGLVRATPICGRYIGRSEIHQHHRVVRWEHDAIAESPGKVGEATPTETYDAFQRETGRLLWWVVAAVRGVAD